MKLFQENKVCGGSSHNSGAGKGQDNQEKGLLARGPVQHG